MIHNASPPTKRRRGRPVGFDRSLALQQAMGLFWERGYEGTSFDDLIGAMRLSPSSFYGAFGSKEGLYREAVDVYAAEAVAWLASELDAATDAKTALHNVLSTAARRFTQDDQPVGCMISIACTSVPPQLAALRGYMTGKRRTIDDAMAARIRRGIADGDTPPDVDADALAAFFAALSRGLAVQARDGASREQLQQSVEIAMQAWPDRRGPDQARAA